LILNQYLPSDELQSTLASEEFDNLEFILKHLLPSENKINSIYSEVELLGQIHHSINIDKYKSKQFRKKLYQCSSTIISPTWEKYFKECGSKDIKKFIEFEWGDNDRTRKFVSFFNYPDYIIPDETITIKAEETIIPGNEKFEPLKTLHSYQSTIVFKILERMKLLNARCLVQMPTGTGKTRTAMEVVAHLFNEDKKRQIVWFANKSELLEQAHEAFIHVWNHLGKYPIKVINIWGDKNIQTVPEEGVMIFAGFQKFNNLLKMKEKLRPHYIIVDEAHQIIATTYNKALRKISDLGNSTRVIGLTATPGRGLNQQQNNLLTAEFDRNIIQIELDKGDKEIFENNILRYLEEKEEVLAKVILDPIKTDYSYDLTENEWNQLTRLVQGDHPEYTKKFLKELASNNTRNNLIIDKLKELAGQGKKILYFSTDLSQSVLVFAALQKLDVKAIHVDGDTDTSFRRQITKKFKDTNEISVICNYDIFAAGFDVPKLDVVFIARPVNSAVLFNQMVGRGTRGPKVDGTPTFTLVQIIDRIKFSRFVGFDPYEQYSLWDDNWKKHDI